MPILQVSNLKKIYTTRFGGAQIQALADVTFSVEQGEYVAIMGESGSGKTTLLNILAALDKPTSGQVLLNGRDIVAIREKDIAAFRRDNLGFVFQDFNLLDTFSVQDNILLPLVLSGRPFREMEEKLRPLAQRRTRASRSAGPKKPSVKSDRNRKVSQSSRAHSTSGGASRPSAKSRTHSRPVWSSSRLSGFRSLWR